LTEAAGHGHVQAQFALADSYMNGRGVAAEPTWAAVWYRRAALGGHKDAAFQLALIEIAGRGAPADTVDAYKWLTIAEGAGHAEARRYRSALKARLSDAERQRAEAEARAFAPAVVRVNYSDEPTILFVQYALARRDYDPGQIDGRIGDRTRAAIAAYARANGLDGAASVTPALVDALRGDLRGRT
jgi:TPR repeat protein